MQDLSYIDQSADELRYALLAGDFDVKKFSVLARETFKIDEVLFISGVLGASHFVSFELPNGNIFHEICACVDIDAGDAPVLKQGMLHEVGQYTTALDTVSYTFASRVIAITEAEAAFTAQVGEVEPHSALIYTFPSKNGEEHLAQTRVTITKKSHLVLATTLHTYPNEGRAVLTESSFDLSGI